MINKSAYVASHGPAIFCESQTCVQNNQRSESSCVSVSYRIRQTVGLALTLLSFVFIQSIGHAQNGLDSFSALEVTPSSTPSVVLTAYSVDGTNSGTARLGRNVTIQASTPGASGASLLWTLEGPGAISSSGVYTAPADMSSNNTATVTATLASNSAVSTTYQMQLLYAVPTIRWMQPSTLLMGKTNSVTIVGYDFTSATTILVGGVAVAATFQAPETMVAQISVPNGTTKPLVVVAKNPTPGGGNSVAANASVQPPNIVLTAYSADGTNSGIARLGRNVTVEANTPGLSNSVIDWTVKGAGTITSAGVYTAPAAMPSGTNVTVTATLASDTSVSTSYKMALEYEPPTIRWISPSSLQSGVTNSVTAVGYDFTPETKILVNGNAVSVAFQAPETIIAQIPVGSVALNSISVVAKNPTPGGGSSPAKVATIQPLTIQINSYNKTGLNPSATPLGREVQFLAVTQGSGDPNLSWAFNWSVQGGGSISSTGLYKAPTTMPTGGTATITAALTTDGSVKATSQLDLLNPAPVVNESAPTQVIAGQTKTVTFTGLGFEPGTALLVDGNPVSTTYVSPSSITAPIAVSSSATDPLSITAMNPSPGGGTSSAFSLMIAGSTTVAATIGSVPGLSIPGDFLGLSHDWNDAQSNMGSQALGVNNIYRQLVQNLTNPGSNFFIRIGGGSTDNSIAPTPTTVEPFVEIANAMPVHFSLGVNLGADNLQLAEQQATFFVSNMPAGSIEALEIGNEPDLYSQNGYRPSTYSLSDYLSDLTQWEAGINPLLPATTRLMGAAWASPWYMQQNFTAMEQQQASQISLVSQHFYEGDQGNTTGFPYDFLLRDSTATAYVRQLGIAATAAHGNGQLFRVGEMNSIDDGGLSGISNTFSAALWAIDAMFEYANVGVDGVNFHGTSGCFYCAFTFGVQNLNAMHVYTLQQVNPLYYGLLFFHQATTNSATLLPVTLSSTPNVKVWATVDKAGTAHVAILNKDVDFAGTVSVTLAGYGQASVERLVASSFQSTAGISIGDQTFDGSIDGTLVGNKTTETIQPSSSVYEVSVQPTSAVLLTLTAP